MKQMMMALLVALCAVMFLSGCDSPRESRFYAGEINELKEEEVYLSAKHKSAFWESAKTVETSIPTTIINGSGEFFVQIRLETNDGKTEILTQYLNTAGVEPVSTGRAFNERVSIHLVRKILVGFAREKGGEIEKYKITGVIVSADEGSPISVIDQDNDGVFDYIVYDIAMVFWPDEPYRGIIADINGKRLDDSLNWGDNLKPICESGKTFSEMTERRE